MDTSALRFRFLCGKYGTKMEASVDIIGLLGTAGVVGSLEDYRLIDGSSLIRLAVDSANLPPSSGVINRQNRHSNCRTFI
jgi:hypothetical protein